MFFKCIKGAIRHSLIPRNSLSVNLAEFLCSHTLSNESPIFRRLVDIANTYFNHLPLFRLCRQKRNVLSFDLP
ncbi:hypothetical protein HNP41_006331 [Pseudomonas aeruginosa]|nr:hypothetical protein [Pseudomonas aeruginosa]